MGTLPGLPGVFIGHAQRPERPTGVTAILIPAGAVGAVDVRGAAPGTRETDLLDPANTVDSVHAVVLAGGSAFGLAAAQGVMDLLAEQGHGLQVGPAIIPIVPAAVLFDLFVGDWLIRPDAGTGRAAAEAALADTEPPAMGSVGAGAGATVGKLLDPMCAMRAGLGWATAQVGPTVVAAMVACNAVGDIRDPGTGQLIAGARVAPDSNQLADTAATLATGATAGLSLGQPGAATTIGAVITNATLGKAGAKRLAIAAHDGIARAVDPAHTTMDGDTIFALATGTEPAASTDLVLLCTLAARVTADAILAGAEAATGLAMGPLQLPAAIDLIQGRS